LITCPAPEQLGQGALNSKKSLLGAHLTHARAGAAGRRLTASSRASARAACARYSRWHIDGFLQPAKCLFKANAHIISQVRTARRTLPATATASAHKVAKKVVKNI
jgi:hypothetical protein